jgi:hypothetical protein
VYKSFLGAVVACGLLLSFAAGPSQAIVLPLNTTHPITFDPANGNFGFGDFAVDYTLPTDGQLYEWDLSFTSADPTATLLLHAPNEIDAFQVFNSTGSLRGLSGFSAPGMTFQEFVTPGLTKILYQAPLAFNNCPVGPASSVPCGMAFNIWGNGDPFTLDSDAPISLTTTFAAVPEPATWAMLLVGFGALGGALRGRRKGFGRVRVLAR